MCSASVADTIGMICANIIGLMMQGVPPDLELLSLLGGDFQWKMGPRSDFRSRSDGPNGLEPLELSETASEDASSAEWRSGSLQMVETMDVSKMSTRFFDLLRCARPNFMGHYLTMSFKLRGSYRAEGASKPSSASRKAYRRCWIRSPTSPAATISGTTTTVARTEEIKVM